MDYGQRIARERAKAKYAAKRAKAAQSRDSHRSRNTNLETFPLRDYAPEKRLRIDWSDTTTKNTSGSVARRLRGSDGSPRLCLLNMPTGTGKTITAIAALGALQRDSHKQLTFGIVAPAKLVHSHHWHERLAAWNRDNPSNQLQPAFIETHTRLANILTSKTGCSQVYDLLTSDGILVEDEAHAYKNPTSKRSKALQKIADIRRLGLTATPLSVDVVSDIGGYLIQAGYYKNKSRYYKETGLDERLDKHYQPMVYDDDGRLSSALWPAWPLVKSQWHTTLYVPDVSLAVNELPEVDSHVLRIHANDSLDSDIRSLKRAYDKRMFDSSTDFVHELQNRILDDEQRLTRLADVLNLHPGSQPLVFYFHTRAADSIETFLLQRGVSCQRIDGSTDIADIDVTDTSRPILVQYLAGAEGIEFPLSRVSVFYENQPSAIRLEQARGRNRRKGMDGKVSHYYLLSDISFEVEVFERVQAREELSNELLAEIAEKHLG